jgi:DNA-binding NtrC family response regulator
VIQTENIVSGILILSVGLSSGHSLFRYGLLAGQEGVIMNTVHRLRVFVVDDEPIISFTLSTILESAGYTARSFSDPLEALRAAETNCPDYLITDVMMPTLNGIDLGMQFKVIYPTVKVLLFSGVSSDHFSKGHDFDILAKPIHPVAFLAAIEALG